jgi:hypothetical protein
MPRPGNTYRGARFNAGHTQPLTIIASENQVTGQKLELMPKPKYRPVQPRGWDWRRGGRAARDAFKAVTVAMAGA